MKRTHTLDLLKRLLVPGQTYRRSDFVKYSSNVDRHLATLVDNGDLKKLSPGLYIAPRNTAFGEAPPEEHSLLRTFLKDDHFVAYSPSQFNALGLGTTQLYNRRIVFNRKRVGEFTLGGRSYSFHRWRQAPKSVTVEFLIVALLNQLQELAEDREKVLHQLKKKLPTLNHRRLKLAATHYGTLATKKRLQILFNLDKKEVHS